MDDKTKDALSLLTFLCYVCLCASHDSYYFSRKPESQSVAENSEVILYCDVSKRQFIEFSWLLGEKQIQDTSRRFQEGSNLRILRVTRNEDEGPFNCVATNRSTNFALQSTDAMLNIQWLGKTAEVELRKPKPSEVALGSELSLKCIVSGNPEPTYLWYHNNFRLLNVKDRKKVSGNRFRITGVTAEDNGIYSCRAVNVAGAVDSPVKFLLNVKAPNTPHLIESQFTRSLLVLKNEVARLDCPFINASRIEWFDDHAKLSNNTRHTIFNNGSLYFPRVRQVDEGFYRCEGLGDNRDIPAQRFMSELILAHLDKFTPISFEPRLMSNFPMVLPSHSRFVVKVFQPSGQPEPTLRWYDRNDLLIGDSGQIHVEEDNLVFENPQEMDSGNYTCVIVNIAGEKRQNVWITVSVPPIIRRPPQPQEVEEDGLVTFNCQATGTRPPVTTVIWDKDGEYVKSGSSRHRMDLNRGTLTISDVQMQDAGAYACVANTTGQDLVFSDRAYLRVRKKLKFDPRPENTFIELLDQDASVPCFAEGDGQVRIKWFKDGRINIAPHVANVEGTLHFYKVQRSDSGLYTCQAYNDKQGAIDVTINIDVVERPRFQVQPKNATVFEGQSAMLHCVASGDPPPMIIWDKNYFTDDFDKTRVIKYSNGTLYLSKVYIQDKGKYGCTANNTAGSIRREAYLNVATTNDYNKSAEPDDEEGFDMMKTIIIAVCSAAAYLALVIGLTAFCSYRMLMQRRNRKSLVKSENGDISREQHELLMKDRDSESRTPFRSDSDNRSHVSGMSSQPSHSSQSQSQCPSHARSRRGSYDRLLFPRQNLQTLGMLGKGSFGDVFLAKARAIRDSEPETLVLVKTLLIKDEQLYFEFKQELDMFAKLDHPYIVKLLGVCREVEPHFMITEYCDWGDLKQYLLATRSDNGLRINRVPPLSTGQKLNMCHQVALALEHLSNHRFVHRDVASRNVMLTSNLSLKLSSMSMCRDAYASEYYNIHQNLIPLRWLPPEAALDNDYSTKSDVWSFGVFVWEVFHLADLPYLSMSNEEVLKRLRVRDLQLDISSDLCPMEITDLIHKCVNESPRDRPQFSELCIYIGDIITGVQPGMNKS
ncbi:inactive tyrosine-protein kinase 7-like [Mizuhopecten yessoensis]|uniref:Inactive tyrosine-protein kinase 7 n=1 Tax=Mizuhopecten yessoensis TaxID=6573 RepID=A0A210QHX2_MIZYE|nr:inactive tyrosine-protein kinase 7-like [Mizuhopecten yessoensis]OWF48337.1 Inactive tyrosine-protein kinase 7 [Mizuhopecten yessoensis]